VVSAALPLDCRILLVDDNEAVRELTIGNLREHFARVDAAGDAAEALALLEAAGSLRWFPTSSCRATWMGLAWRAKSAAAGRGCR